MTEEQKQELNPLTIKIKCVSCLPSQPVSIPELEVRGSQTPGFESCVSQPTHNVSPLIPPHLMAWLRSWVLISVFPFRISEPDVKEINFLG